MGNRSNASGPGDIAAFEANPRAWLFPEPIETLRLTRPPIQEVADQCLFVFDTNVLLLPCGLGKNQLEVIEGAFQKTKKKGQFFVPAQVLREFASIRGRKLEKLLEDLQEKPSKLPSLSVEYPILASSSHIRAANKAAEDIARLVTSYVTHLRKARDEVAAWEYSDPVVRLLEGIVTAETVIDSSQELSELAREMAIRYKHRIPPGYEDADKNDEGIGDLVIWKSILELAAAKKKNVVFVSGERKSDWLQSSNGRVLFPRLELIVEFRRASSGRSFYMVEFSQFLKLKGIGQAVVEAVRAEESRQSPSIRIRDTRYGVHPKLVIDAYLRLTGGTLLAPPEPRVEPFNPDYSPELTAEVQVEANGRSERHWVWAQSKDTIGHRVARLGGAIRRAAAAAQTGQFAQSAVLYFDAPQGIWMAAGRASATATELRRVSLFQVRIENEEILLNPTKLDWSRGGSGYLRPE